MSWQEELRKLDEELAAGKISADDYRVRRDQVLSSAVTQDESTAAPQQGDKPAADSTQVIAPVSQQQGNQQHAQPQTGASSWHVQQPVQQASHQQARSSSPSGVFQRPNQPWNAPEQDMTPPWGGSDLPPTSAGTASEWAGHGPEGFESSQRSGKRRIIAVASAAVAVLLIAGAVLFFTVANKSGETQAAGGNQQRPAPPPATTAVSTTPPRETAGALVVPRGQAQGPTTFTQEELLNSKALPEPGRLIVEQVGITKARSVFAVRNGVTTTLWSFKTDQPSKLHEKLIEDQKRFGFENTSSGNFKVEVFTAVQQNSDQDVFVSRTHYIADSAVVRVQSFGTDKASVRERFETILNAQLKHTPVTK